MRHIAAERTRNIHDFVIAFVICSWYNGGVRRTSSASFLAEVEIMPIKTTHDSGAKIILVAIALQRTLREANRNLADSELLGHVSAFIVTDKSNGPKIDTEE